MDYIIEKKIKVIKYGSYNGYAFFLQSLRNHVSPHFGSILIINHRLPASLLLTIAENSHADIDIVKEFISGIYHADKGTLFNEHSTVIVFRPLPFEQEINLAKQFCELYGAKAVLIKPSSENNLYEVYPQEGGDCHERCYNQPE